VNTTMLRLALAELAARWRSTLGMALVIGLSLLCFLFFDAHRAGLEIVFSSFDPGYLVVQSMDSIGEIYGSRLPAGLEAELSSRGARLVVPEIHTIVGGTPASAMLLRGIALDRYLQMEGFKILAGRPLQADDAPRRAMIGVRLAEKLDLVPGGQIEIRGRLFDVVGVFEIGTYADHEAWISLTDAQSLLGWGSDVSVFVVPTDQGLRPGDLLSNDAMVVRKGDSSANLVREWAPMFNLLSTIAAALSVAAMVALANLLWRLAWQRRRELAIMRSLGFGQNALNIYLLGQALTITGLGFFLGTAAALILSALTRADAVGITLRAHFNPAVIAAGLALALLISVAGTVLPALQISRLNLAALLRDE